MWSLYEKLSYSNVKTRVYGEHRPLEDLYMKLYV